MFEAYLDFIDWLESRCIFDGAARTLGITLSPKISQHDRSSYIYVKLYFKFECARVQTQRR